MPAAPTSDPMPAPDPAREQRSGVRRRRVLAGVLLIVLVAVPCLVGVLRTDAAVALRERSTPVAEGSIPGGLQVQAEPGQRYVIALSAKPGQAADDASRDRPVGATISAELARQARCAVRPADGTTQWVRGFEQSSAVVVDDRYATVGTFVGKPGSTTVGCVFMPEEDSRGEAIRAPLMVHADSSLRNAKWAFLAGLVLFGGLGLVQILRGTVWRGRRAG